MSLLNDILEHLDQGPVRLLTCIDEYMTTQPYDCMIDTARAVVLFFAQDYEAAEKWILSALQKNPYNYMNHFYYALVAKSLGQYETSATECWITFNLATQFEEPPGWKDLLEQLNSVLEEIASKLSQEEAERFAVRRNILRSHGSFFPAYFLVDQERWSLFVGSFLYYDKQKPYNDYVGFWGQSYMDSISFTLYEQLVRSGNYNAYAVTPTEIWKAQETKKFTLEKKNHVLAVAATAPDQTFTISSSQGKRVDFCITVPNIYHYINLDQPGTVLSNQKFIISKPIPMECSPGKKRLVLTIFMDALSQWYLTKTDYRFMPYTKKFFEKGTVFKNCYATGEWTHPSVASLSTGLYTTHHHIIYRSSAYQYPPQTKTVGEIFNENGYFTFSVSGSVGTSPYIGGLRGFDGAIYKSCVGFPDSHLIADVVDYLDAFSKTNKFISLGLFEEHRVIEDSADSILSLSIPQQTELEFYNNFARKGSAQKSVWMRHSQAHIRKYEASMRECDRQLKRIYDYLEENYREDEYIVCFYSDHGVSMLSEESFLLKATQTNSVLMLRGSGVPAQISEEYVNHFDYIPVLAKLADIPFDFSGHDCILPRTFGGPGRDFVYTESIYHGQSYKAAVRTEDFEGRFETNGLTDNDGLIDMSQGFTLKITSMQTGEEIQDQELAEDFNVIVFDHIKENIKY